MNCRHCGSQIHQVLLDLGSAPPSNAYLEQAALSAPEAWYPLRVLVCNKCWLVQAQDYARPEQLFDESYAYFSSISTSWLAHAKTYAGVMISRFGLNASSQVCEVAANDGYLLQYFQQAGVPCYGVEPTASTAAAARRRGLEITERFFGVELAHELAAQGRRADLIAANNVLAHVPDINDFVRGFSVLLKPGGVATFEFPHLLRMMSENQFDTVYHEHFSYLSLTAVDRVFRANGLSAFDVEQHPTHGGSLRVFAQGADSSAHAVTQRVRQVFREEEDAGMNAPAAYAGFQSKADKVKNDLLAFLLSVHAEGKSVAAYGAAAKGNTLMNYAGVRPDLVRFVADANPAKQGKFMPGSRIPIVDEDHLKRHRPDYILLLPWNLKPELMRQLAYARDWDAQFVIAVPRLEVL